MKRFLLCILFILIALPGIVAMATATYSADINLSNNTSTNYGMFPAQVVSNNTLLVTNGFVTASGLDSRVQSSGSDLKWLLADNATYFAANVPALSSNTYQFVTGQTAASAMQIISGYNGYVRTPDSANLEWSGNGSANFSGYVDTSLTYSFDDFNTFTQVDFSDNISIPNGLRINTSNASSVQNYYAYKDYTAGHFTNLNVQFEIFTHADASTSLGHNGIAFTNTLSSIFGLAATDLFAVTQPLSATTMKVRFGRGNFVAVSDSAIMPSDNTLYMVLLHSAGSDSAQLNIYSDPDYSTNVTSLFVSGLGATSWRYGFGNINFNDGTPNRLWTGYVQNRTRDIINKGILNTSVYNGGITAQAFDNNSKTFTVVNKALASGVYVVTPVLNATNFGLSVDGGAATTNSSASIPDTAANWTLLRSVVYGDNISLSVGGTQQAFYEPNTIVINSLLTDRSADATNNDATIIWGANPIGVSTSISSLLSTQVITANVTSSQYIGNFMPGNVTTPLSPTLVQANAAVLTNPLYYFVEPFATISNTPIVFFYWFGTIIIAIAGFIFSYRTKHLLISAIAFDVPFGFGIVVGYVPWWVVILLTIWTIGAAIQETRM